MTRAQVEGVLAFATRAAAVTVSRPGADPPYRSRALAAPTADRDMTPTPTEPISTERLDLLPLRVEHAAEMAGVLSDPALHTFMGGSPESPVGLASRYERLVAGSSDPTVSWCNWVISLRAERRLTGTVQATITSDELGSVAEIAWVVGTRWQGRGIATEAAQGLAGWLDDRVHTLVAHIHPDHAASAAVAAACGLAPTDHVVDGEIRWSRSSSSAPP